MFKKICLCLRPQIVASHHVSYAACVQPCIILLRKNLLKNNAIAILQIISNEFTANCFYLFAVL